MKKGTLAVVLLWIVLAAVAANMVMTLKFRSELTSTPSLPCAAVPTRFVTEHPECADKLLRSMNVTNVQIRSRQRVPLSGDIEPYGPHGSE